MDGKIMLNSQKHLLFAAEGVKTESGAAAAMPSCPQCRSGRLIKGKTAYGCSMWKSGCKFRYSFEKIRQEAGGKKLTKELVLQILTKNS